MTGAIRVIRAKTAQPCRSLQGYWLGRRPYAPIHDWMETLHGLRRSGSIGDVVLLLEHEPVVTLGRGAKPEHLLAGEQELRRRGIDLVKTGRGGDVTLHAPGQLIAYPIVDLRPDRQDVRRYVQALTRTMQRLVEPFGIAGGAIDGKIGLWVDEASIGRWPGEQHAQTPKKIGAVGVRISRWVTGHGFALNLSTDLSLFQWIVPCGIREHGVTSVESLRAEQGAAPATVEQLATPTHHALASELSAEPTVLLDWSQLPTDELTAERVQRSFISGEEITVDALRVARSSTLLGER